MTAYAEALFALSDADRKSIESLVDKAKDERRRKKLEAELDLPHLPAPLVYLWNLYARLSARRSAGGFGPSRLSWQDIDAFQRVTGRKFNSWEVEVVEALDDIEVTAMNEASKRAAEQI